LIVCHCNVLTDRQILATLTDESVSAPRTPAQAYRCLGCKPDCGRCLQTVRALLAEARAASCSASCPACPANHEQVANDRAPMPFVHAAE
jgi:bacterioferritin-associated ferredoxin